MLQCSPKCPTVRRQLREEVKKAGWTDDYVRNIVDVRRVDIARDLEGRLGRQVKSDRRGKRPGPGKRVTQELKAISRSEKARQKDPTPQDLVRVTDHEQPIAEVGWRKDDIQEPVASLKQESIYYTEERQIARVDPIRKISPKESKPQRDQSPISQIVTAPIEDETRFVQKRGEVVAEAAAAYRETPKSKVVDYEIPGPSKIVDKKVIKGRDDSPDNYYKYTPKEVSNGWPHEDCDETCPAGILKERAEKLLGDGQRRAVRYSTIGQRYFDDVCTCSLPCMIQNLRKDPFVRSIIVSTIFFALGIKLCSELHGWYIPISAE